MILVFALLSEAKPWIEILGAKGKGHSLGAIRVFESPQATILVTGMGKLSSAIAVTWLSGELSQECRASSQIWNLGGSGSVSRDKQLGSFFWIHQIRDLSSGKEEFPAVLDFAGDFPECALVTADKAFLSLPSPNPLRETDLVDMEAFGFFQAAVQFFPHENIRIGKWVTDYLHLCDPAESDKFARQSCEKIFPLISLPSPKEKFFPDSSDLIKAMNRAKELGYTEAMLQEVETHLKFFKLQFPNKEFPQFPSYSEKKEDRKIKHSKWKAQFAI